MDVVSVLTIILSVFGLNFVFFGYLLNKIDSGTKDLTDKIDDVRKVLSGEIQKNREEIMWIKFRLDPHEHTHRKEDDSKEN